MSSGKVFIFRIQVIVWISFLIMFRVWKCLPFAMFLCKSQIAFHGISTNKEEIVLDGSEAPIRIDAEALLSLENLAPAAVLNKVERCYYLEYIHAQLMSTL